MTRHPRAPLPTLDYDQVADTYNTRFHMEHDRPQVAAAVCELAYEVAAYRVLEVGCGTARWLAGLSDMGMAAYGLDPSWGMLAQAQARPAFLSLTRGRGEQLPFSDATFDLVYCVNAIHHMRGQRDFVQEARRVLRRGAVAVLALDTRAHRDDWYIYDYFPGTYALDLARHPDHAEVLEWLRDAGLKRVQRHVVDRIAADKVGRAVLADPFLRKDAVSQLAMLSDAAYDAGIRRIQAAIAAAEFVGETLIFPTRLVMEMLVGYLE